MSHSISPARILIHTPSISRQEIETAHPSTSPTQTGGVSAALSVLPASGRERRLLPFLRILVAVLRARREGRG